MNALFDHLTGLIVAGAVLLIYAFIQFRGWQSASEATIHNTVYTNALSVSRVIQTDIENLRTEDQTNEAHARGNLTGGTSFSCQLTTAGGLTTSFTFPTLGEPGTDYTLADPADARVALVTYSLVDTGNVMKLREGSGTNTVPIYRLDRLIDGQYTGGSQSNITHFMVELSAKGSSTFSSSTGTCPTELEKVRFELKLATEGLGAGPDGQENNSQINISRFGTTVTLENWE